MATLTIRSLPDAVHRRLRLRAAEKGRSMEAEARAILEANLAEGDRRAAWQAAGADIRAHLRAANGGELPPGMLDDFLAEKRRHAAAELGEVEKHPRTLIGDGKS